VIFTHILRGEILFRFNGRLFRFGFMLEFTGEICVMSEWLKFMEYAYSRVYGCYYNTFYEVEFYVNFRGCVFGLSFQSNVWIDYTCFVYGLSLCDRFTG